MPASLRKWDDPWWTRKPSRFERIHDKLDGPFEVLALIALLEIGAYHLWGWIGVTVVTAIMLVAAVAFGILFLFLWIVAKIYESGRW